ncbi:uncharacterized protein LOC101944303 isoform X11 [Chrysemys picta bellii]|uniref:uncharacterized protein LOC101944303 isoform X11 n=1 Tax=Chrysemys picta bellii TaxID=8478 RepID=UPI0032B25447
MRRSATLMKKAPHSAGDGSVHGVWLPGNGILNCRFRQASRSPAGCLCALAMSVLSHPCGATLPLFGDLQDQNVTFVVSMLEGMSSKQDFLKEHLIKTLFSMANSPTESTFNIISFASKVVKWCTSLVKCSLSNIIEATAWIRALQCGNGADAVSALAMAFEDPTCQVVYLVTDALSESASEEICSLLAETGEERPVHTVYLVEKPGDCESSTQKEMEKVAKQSGGSFQVITLHPSRASEEVNPGCTSSIHCCNAISKYPSCSLLMGIPKAHFPVYVCANSPRIPLTTLTKGDLMDWSPEAPHLLRGARVLARRETDGYYYLGHIAQEVKSPQKEMTSTRLMGGARAMVDIAVHPDTCLMEPMHDDKEDSRHYGADPDSLQKNEPALFQSSMIEAPAQHPPRNPPVKAHAFSTSSLQAMFDRVDQSLKKDRLTIESVLRIQRPHSAPSTQKSVTKGATQESLRMMNFNTARIEHRRQQEELRQQKREQKQEAEGLKCQLMRDSRRERSLQRTLQSLEKQLEYNNMACQHMAKLQTARAERSRKESSLQEEEKRKECQRLQFLKAQHLQREELQAEYNQRNYDQDKKRQDMLRSRMQSRQETLEREIQEQDTQQRKREDAKWRAFQNRDHFQQKLEKECQKHYHLQQYLREQKLLMLRASLLS